MQTLSEISMAILTNVCFLSIQLLLVCAWFSWRNGRWTNVTESLLGWGDILFLTSIAFGLSVFSFLFFYIISLAIISTYWAALQAIRKNDNLKVPLAGLQALLLALILSGDWWLFHVNLTNDDWAFKMISQ
jgi:hypothetical protein